MGDECSDESAVRQSITAIITTKPITIAVKYTKIL